jgi:hypothetical protein
LFDIGPAGEAEEADRDVSHGGHDLWGGAGPDLGSVFVEGDVADMVGAVLYSPVAAVEGQHVGGVGLAGGEAGDAVHGLVACAQWVAVQVEHLAGDRPGLVNAGEVQVRDVCGADDRPGLVTAVAAVKRDVVRGEKTRPRRRTGP